MRDELAGPVYAVLLHGLHLRDRLGRGERPSLGTEQAKAKALLGPADSPAPWGGGHDPTRSVGASESGSGFLGVRYALACWLDEVMIDGGWREWDENKLESSLYRMNIRYSNFWAQARLAEASPAAADAELAFLLCAALGFRGELADAPDRFKEWVSAARARAVKAVGREPVAPPENVPVTDVPVLDGVERYRKMVSRLVAAVLVAVPVAAFLVVVLVRDL